MTFRRVVVALDTASAATAMATAIDFARTMEAELVGLFVEDQDLINLAALAAAEVGFPFPARRALDPDTMERALRARARVVRAALAARLAGGPVKWTFEVVRGRTFAALTAAAAAQDVVVVPLAGTAAGVRTQAVRDFADLAVPLLFVAGPAHADGTLGVLPGERAVVEDVAQLVAALAPRHGRSALFVLVGDDAHWQPWAHAMRARLAGAAIATRFRVVARATRPGIERLLAEAPARLLVALSATPEGRAALLEALPLPLLVLPRGDAGAR